MRKVLLFAFFMIASTCIYAQYGQNFWPGAFNNYSFNNGYIGNGFSNNYRNNYYGGFNQWNTFGGRSYYNDWFLPGLGFSQNPYAFVSYNHGGWGNGWNNGFNNFYGNSFNNGYYGYGFGNQMNLSINSPLGNFALSMPVNNRRQQVVYNYQQAPVNQFVPVNNTAVTYTNIDYGNIALGSVNVQPVTTVVRERQPRRARRVIYNDNINISYQGIGGGIDMSKTALGSLNDNSSQPCCNQVFYNTTTTTTIQQPRITYQWCLCSSTAPMFM